MPLSVADCEPGTRYISGGNFRKTDVEAMVLFSLWVSFHTSYPSSHKGSLTGLWIEFRGSMNLEGKRIVPSFFFINLI